MSHSARKLWSIRTDRRAPIDPLQQHRKLCRCQCRRRSGRRRGPNKAALLKPLGKQTQALTVPPQHFDEPAPPAAENKRLTRERITSEVVLHKSRQTPCAWRSSLLQARRVIHWAPESSAHQCLDHAAQQSNINRCVSAQPMTSSYLNLDRRGRRAFSRHRVGWCRQKQWNKSRLWW